MPDIIPIWLGIQLRTFYVKQLRRAVDQSNGVFDFVKNVLIV